MSTPTVELAAQELLPDFELTGENVMLPPLMDWLVRSGRIGARTSVAYEVPWLGRRIDLALLSGSGATTAFELKLGSYSRALEQAIYNAAAFHRSWIVIGNRPRDAGLRLAAEYGIGVLSVRAGEIANLLMPVPLRPDPIIVGRLRRQIVQRATGTTS